MTKNCKIFSIVLTFAVLFLAKASFAGCDGFYLAGRIGGMKYHVDDNKGEISHAVANYVVDKKLFIANGGFGYRYGHFRTELGYIWRKDNSRGVGNYFRGRLKSYSYMFIVYYDFFPNYWFTPFVDVGAGYTKHKLRVSNSQTSLAYSSEDDNFTWSVGGGLSAKLTSRLNLDVGYRFYDLGELSVRTGKADINTQEVYMGLRYIL